MMMGLRGVKGWFAAILAAAALGGQAAHAQLPVSETQLETFLGLSTGGGLNAGDLTNLGNGPVTSGSAIMQTIGVSAGETLSFDYNFLTNAPPIGGLGGLDPFAFIMAPTLMTLSDNGYNSSPPTPTSPGSAYAYQSGVTMFSETFMTAETFSFGLGVANVTTDQYGSALDVSNFMLSGGSLGTWSMIGEVSPDGSPGGFVMSSSVPEPSSIVLLVLGGLGVAVAYRRRSSRAIPIPLSA
jgi:hypothetical protein